MKHPSQQPSIPALLKITALAGLVLLAGACARPLADSAALSAERTGQAVTGYERSSYVYPVAVPGSNRYVTITTREPVDRPLTYGDYLAWQADGKLPEK